MSDGLEENTYDLFVQVQKNSLPYFVSEVGPIIYKQNSGIHIYSLPEVMDNDGDSVTIDVEFVGRFTFGVWYPDRKEMSFTVDKNVLPAEDYSFTISLGDGIGYNF